MLSDRKKDLAILVLAVLLAVAVTGWWKSDRVLTLEATIRKQSALMAEVNNIVVSVKGWPQNRVQQFRRLGIDVPDPPMQPKPEKEGATNGTK